MIKKIKKMLFGMSAALLVFAGAGGASAADIDVEGFYTAAGSAVVAEIYANINISRPVISYGIRLAYDQSQMNIVSAQKNESVWFLGDGTPSGNKAYMDPDTSTPGQVIIIGGKLDTSAPVAGVTGRRVLLGRVTFNRSNTSYRPVLSIDYAKPAPYSNFVGTDGTILDSSSGIGMATGVFELGDVSKNGKIDSADLIAVRNYMASGIYSVLADCSANSKIDSADLIAIKNKIGK